MVSIFFTSKSFIFSFNLLSEDNIKFEAVIVYEPAFQAPDRVVKAILFELDKLHKILIKLVAIGNQWFWT